MRRNKEKLKEKAMEYFVKKSGGTKIDSSYSTLDSNLLKKDLQKSFESIFPELIKSEKHRKHVIFDDDVFQFFDNLCENNGSKFSSLINSALRTFIKERLFRVSEDEDPVAEFLSIRERERELLKKIQQLDLTKELKKKLG
jgi:hypothetical protein